MKKTVLAYSGGLDTSFCAVYLSQEKGMEVHAVTVNTGGFSDEELAAMEQRALSLGVASFTVLNEVDQYYQNCIRFLIYGNVLKNNTYPLSVSAERITQANAIAAFANSIKADAIAHGSTGAGNDQVRFDMVFRALNPDMEIITPIRDLRLSRQEEISYLQQRGISLDFSKSGYSVNKGLWGTSVGGAETLTSDQYLPESAWPTPLSRSDESEVKLHFVKGELTGINEVKYTRPAEAIRALQQMVQPYAIGRDIHVGDTIIGIKGRVGFEAAAPMIIIKAHHALEKHVLSKNQLMIKDQLSLWYGNWVHEGLFNDPVMRDIEAFLESSKQKVSGTVFVQLLPYRFIIRGIQSENDLMSSEFGAYGEMNNTWTGEDVKGFSKIFSNGISIYHRVNSRSHE